MQPPHLTASQQTFFDLYGQSPPPPPVSPSRQTSRETHHKPPSPRPQPLQTAWPPAGGTSKPPQTANTNSSPSNAPALTIITAIITTMKNRLRLRPPVQLRRQHHLLQPTTAAATTAHTSPRPNTTTS
ncbi:hypothetical protein Landi51_03754 [Colletotrichum acutatum]